MQVLELLIAGTDTSSVTLSWIPVMMQVCALIYWTLFKSTRLAHMGTYDVYDRHVRCRKLDMPGPRQNQRCLLLHLVISSFVLCFFYFETQELGRLSLCSYVCRFSHACSTSRHASTAPISSPCGSAIVHSRRTGACKRHSGRRCKKISAKTVRLTV